MFNRFYGFSEDPFRLTPDHSYCFNHEHFARARAYMDYGLLRAEGFVMITGQPGTGKTTLIRDLQARISGTGATVAVITSTKVDPEGLLRLSAHAFGLKLHHADKVTLLQCLTDFFITQQNAGGRALLVVDEAQNLSSESMEELRLLTNFESLGRPLLQVVLVGQEPLRDLILGEGMEQVQQRIVAAWHLEPLAPAETVGYVRHRLERAGWYGDPSFQSGVLRIVHEHSRGIPRVINLVCSRLLLRGFSEDRHELTVEDAECVAQELFEENLTPRNRSLAAKRASVGAASGASDSYGDGEGSVDWSLIDPGLVVDKALEPQRSTRSEQCVADEPLEPLAVNASSVETIESPVSHLESGPVSDLMKMPSGEEGGTEAPAPVCVTGESSFGWGSGTLPESGGVLRHEDGMPLTASSDGSGIAMTRDASSVTPHQRKGMSGRWVGYGVLGLVCGLVAGTYFVDPASRSLLMGTLKGWMHSAALKLETLEGAARNMVAEQVARIESHDTHHVDSAPEKAAAPDASEHLVQASDADTPNADDGVHRGQKESVESGHGARAAALDSNGVVWNEASLATSYEEVFVVDVGFSPNSTLLDQQFETILDRVVALLGKTDGSLVRIQGAAARLEDGKRGVDRGRRRAEAVADYLVKRGIPRERMEVLSQRPQQAASSVSALHAASVAQKAMVHVSVLKPIIGDSDTALMDRVE